MATPTFYYPELSREETSVNLSASESAHAQKSRRLGVGQPIKLIDGLGRIADGEISLTQRNAITVKLHQQRLVERPLSSSIIATAIPKGDRQRNMIDMLTQLGVQTIIPLRCEHSVTRNNTKQIAKWQRLAIEGCKQSQNPWMPDIVDELTVAQLLEWSVKEGGLQCFYADDTGAPMPEESKRASKVMVAIGPEGGFSKTEFCLFKQAKFTVVGLGKYILRTETAAVCAASQLLDTKTT